MAADGIEPADGAVLAGSEIDGCLGGAAVTVDHAQAELPGQHGELAPCGTDLTEVPIVAEKARARLSARDEKVGEKRVRWGFWRRLVRLYEEADLDDRQDDEQAEGNLIAAQGHRLPCQAAYARRGGARMPEMLGKQRGRMIA